MVDNCCKLDDAVAAKDGIVWVGNVYHVEGYELCSLGVAFAEGHIQLYFAKGFDSFAPEANKRALRLVQVFLCQTHLDEALPSENVCGAAVVDKDPTYVVSREVYRISANVCTDDKGVVMRIVLKPEVGFGEGDWDMGPGSAEMLAFADMRDSAEVFFPLTLRLVYWLIQSAGDGIDDVHRASDWIIGSL